MRVELNEVNLDLNFEISISASIYEKALHIGRRMQIRLSVMGACGGGDGNVLFKSPLYAYFSKSNAFHFTSGAATTTTDPRYQSPISPSPWTTHSTRWSWSWWVRSCRLGVHTPMLVVYDVDRFLFGRKSSITSTSAGRMTCRVRFHFSAIFVFYQTQSPTKKFKLALLNKRIFFICIDVKVKALFVVIINLLTKQAANQEANPLVH